MKVKGYFITLHSKDIGRCTERRIALFLLVDQEDGLILTDGGPGDLDGLANGIIVSQ